MKISVVFLILFLLLLSLISTSCAKKEPRVVDMFAGMKPPVRNDSLPARNVQTSFLMMPVDHFDPHNSATFRLKFMYNEEFFGGDGSPIFIMIGGDWPIYHNWLTNGNMYEMARENKGYQVYVEHRYYGESQVFTTSTTENLRFLNANQALADLAYFITEMKRQPRFVRSKVILYGGAYAGKLAMWFQQRYPHLAVGSVASSAAILAKVEISELLEVVHEAFLLEGGEQCIAHIRQGIHETVTALQTENGKRTIEEVFSLCDRIVNILDFGQFSGLIAWTFMHLVMNSRLGQLKDICNNFDNNVYGATPMQQIAGLISEGTNTENRCWDTTFESSINVICSMDMNMASTRSLYYQNCAEYGYFQTAPKSGIVFDDLTWLNPDFYNEICLRCFDKRFDRDFVNTAVDRVNLALGGLKPEVKNVINIHAWRVLGVYKEDISETSPTFTVDRASHCFDFIEWAPSDDNAEMIAVQQEARRIVASWPYHFRDAHSTFPIITN